MRQTDGGDHVPSCDTHRLGGIVSTEIRVPVFLVHGFLCVPDFSLMDYKRQSWGAKG